MDNDYDDSHLYLSVDLDMIAEKIGEGQNNLPFMKSCSMTLSVGRADEMILENYDERNFVKFKSSKEDETREPDILKQFLAIVRLKTAISRYITRK